MMNKKQHIGKRAGFTLLEMTVVLIVSLTIASASLALLNQNLSFYRKMQDQHFLTSEAPMVGTIMAKIIAEADRYVLHEDLLAYSTGAQQVLSGARCLSLLSISESQVEVTGLVIMDPVLGTLSYHDPVTLQQRWVISRVLHDAVFQFTNGILQMRLEGPNQELITYSGSFKL